MAYLGNQVAPLVQALEGKELKLDSDGDSSIQASVDDTVVFKTNGSNRWTLNSSGNLFPASTSQGIVLGATSDTASNTLSDYEEGTWTPTAGTNSGTFDSGTRVGKYTKIGDIVYIMALFQFTGASTNANRTITGLPFTIDNLSAITGVDYFGHSWNGNHYGLVHFNGTTTEAVDNYSAILAGSFASSGTTRIMGWYKTSS